MQLKFLFLVLIFCLAPTFSMAQEKNFSYPIEFSISLKEAKFSWDEKTILFNLKVTNNLSSAINTEQFDTIMVNLSRNWDKRNTDKAEMAFFKLEPKIIKAGESFETEMDLRKLSWIENPSSSYFDVRSTGKSKYQPVWSGNYFLSVAAGNCREVLPENSITVVVRRECESNRVLLSFKTPAKSQ